MLTFTSLLLTATVLSSASVVLSSPDHNNLNARKAHTRRGHNAAGLRLRGNINKRADPVLSGALLLAVANTSVPIISPNSLIVKQALMNSTAMWFEANHGACAVTYNETSVIVGIPLAFWNTTTIPSSLCGSSVYVYNPATNQNITAIVGDASGISTITLSKVAFVNVGGNLDAGSAPVQWQFTSVLNAVLLASTPPTTESNLMMPGAGAINAALIAAALNQNSVSAVGSSSVATPTSPTAAQISQSSLDSASSASSVSAASAASAWAAASSQSSVSAASVASVAWVSSMSQDSVWAAEASASSVSADKAWADQQSSSSAAAAAAAASQKASNQVNVVITSGSSKSSSNSNNNGNSNGNQVYTGGYATYFYQNGVAGACGKVNSDSSYVIAIDQRMYNGGANCGRSITITNTNSGAQVTATVADMCPTCDNGTSLDLSEGAFEQIATKSQGQVGITWHFN